MAITSQFEIKTSDSKVSDRIDSVIIFILKDYKDLSDNDQYLIFTKLCFYKIDKREFFNRRRRILKEYEGKLSPESITLTDVRAIFHIKEGALSNHLDKIEQMKNQIDFYSTLYETVREELQIKINNGEEITGGDLFKLTKISRMLNELIQTSISLEIGTPIIMYFRLRMSNQLNKSGLQNNNNNNNKDHSFFKNDNDVENPILINKSSNKNIAEDDKFKDSLDELERYSKLKNQNDRHSRSKPDGNGNESINKDERVHANIPISDSTDSSREDRGTEYFKKDHSRRSEEGIFS